MCLIKTIEKIQYLDHLIRSRRTGGARELADQIGVSERTVYNYLSEFRSMGAPVSWSFIEQSYIYDNSVQFIFGFRSENPLEQDTVDQMLSQSKLCDYSKREKSWPAGDFY